MIPNFWSLHLRDFFLKHPLINPQTFLGDSAFDTAQLYKDLLSSDTFGKDKHFSKAYIPLNIRSHLENMDYYHQWRWNTLLSSWCEPCHETGRNKKEEERISKLLNSSVQRSNGSMTSPLKNNIVNVNVKIPVLLPNVGEWFTSIPKRIFVPIPVYSVVRMSGTKPTKSERL